MTAPIYATVEQYGEWAQDESHTMTLALLARASDRIDEALVGAVYVVDTADHPTDSRVAAALRDATCAQAQWMDAIGDTTGAGDVVISTDSASIGSVSFSGRKTASEPIRLPSGVVLAAAAYGVLRTAGLLPIRV